MAKRGNNLESLLGSRAKIALLRFLSKNGDWQFNLSSISSRIGIDKGALSRVIKELEDLGALEIKRQGKLLLFRIDNRNKILSQLVIPMFRREGKK